ncbi:MAG: S24/S26 family peptidase [Pseudomonadota bacterium]
MIRLFRVSGRSMLPTLEDGDFFLALAVRNPLSLKPGTVVRLIHPHFGPMVKRLSGYDQHHHILLSSDGQTGADSADLGTIPAQAITHRMLFRIPRRR